MKIVEQSRSSITVIVNQDELMMIRGCIMEVWDKLSGEKVRDQIGVSGEFLHNILIYSREIRDRGFSKNASPSPTLCIARISNDECRISMGMKDIAIKCMKIALDVLPDWEFPILIGAGKTEVGGLLSEFSQYI